MRELKFRAWDKGYKEWMRLFQLTPIGMITMPGNDAVLGPDRVIVEQFIGLYDKNGREIYEGDIYRMEMPKSLRLGGEEYVYSVVKWFDELVYDAYFGKHPGFYLDDDNDLHADFTGQEGEVAGNIHENPELLNDT